MLIKNRLLFFISFFLTTSFLYAQQEDSIKKYSGFIVGIEQNSLMYIIKDFHSNSLDVNIVLKKEIYPFINLRLGMGRVFDNRFSIASYIGAEKKIQLSSLLNMYVGCDVLYYTRYYAYKKHFFLGTGPFVGIDYRIGNKFFIGTESSIQYGKSDMIDGELKWGVVDMYKFLSLHIFYKF